MPLNTSLIVHAYNIQLVTDISFLSNNWESCSNRPTRLAWSNYSLLLPWRFFKATWWVSPQWKVFMLQICTSDTSGPKEQNQKLSPPPKPGWCFVRGPSAADPASCLRARGRCGPCHTMTSQLCCVRLARKHGGNEMGCCISSWHAPWATFYSLLLLTSCPSLALQVLSPCRFERHAARGTPLRLTGCLRSDSRTGAEWNILSKTRC